MQAKLLRGGAGALYTLESCNTFALKPSNLSKYITHISATLSTGCRLVGSQPRTMSTARHCNAADN
jgi:hypothetical protein